MAAMGFHEVGTQDRGGGGGDKREHNVFGTAMGSPIKAACLLPPVFSTIRLWQRVAVPTAKANSGERKIWKRVAHNAPTVEGRRYQTGILELQRQGAGQRKRGRFAGYVPAWGDAKWDAKVKDTRDGKWDLVEAKVSVIAAKPVTSEIPVVNSKPSTFPEASLQFVPRKRHNSRFPIEPAKKSAPMIAEDQPLIKFDVPDDLEKLASEAVVQKADEKKMRRRSTRRMSRRLTISPIEEQPSLAVPPAIAAQVQLSPMQHRSIHQMTPRSVAMSPAKHFKMSATPVKVIMEECESPCASTSPSICESKSISANSSADSSQPVLDLSLPIVFEQTSDELRVEPQYETKRRATLHSARRSSRRSSGVQRLLLFETQEISTRQFTFVSGKVKAPSSKGRRHTVAVTGGREVEITVMSPEEKPEEEVGVSVKDSSQLTQQVASLVQPGDQAVDIDLRANLDIFSQNPIVPNKPSAVLVVNEGHTSSKSGAISIFSATADTSMSLESCGQTIEAKQVNFDSYNILGLVPQDSTLAIEQATPSSAPETGLEWPIQPIRNPRQLIDVDNTATSDQLDNMGAVFSCLCGSKETNATPTEQPAQSGLLSPTENDGQGRYGDDDASPGDAAADTSLVTGLDFYHSMRSASGQSSDTVIITKPTPEETASSQFEDGDGRDVSSAEEMSVMDIHDQAPNMATKTLDAKLTSSTDNNNENSNKYAEPASPITPLQTVSSVPARVETLNASSLETPPRVSGFTPINGRSSLSPRPISPQTEQVDDIAMTPLAAEHFYQCDEATITIGMDFSPAVDGEDGIVPMDMEKDVQNEKRQSLHDDSDTEKLRDFVARVKADKTAKAAAAARANLNTRPQRRSSSVGTTSDSGSPVSRKESGIAASPTRLPLGDKDVNQSPSPAKKRKVPTASVPKTTGPKPGSRLSKPDLDDISPPRPKRRRKKIEVENADSVFNPEFAPSQSQSEATEPAPRRSTRARNARTPLKPPANTANSAALSLIPVRLPGALNLGAGDDAFGPTTARRDDTKELAKLTTQNTRRNKAGAEPPRDVLARQASDPLWRQRELKSTMEARERAAKEGEESSSTEEEPSAKGKKKAASGNGGKNKAVRWAETLARFQGDDQTEPVVMKAVSSGLDETSVAKADTDMADADIIDEDEAFEVVALPRPPRSTLQDLIDRVTVIGQERVAKHTAETMAAAREENKNLDDFARQTKTKGRQNAGDKDSAAGTAAAQPKEDGKKPAVPAVRRTRASKLQPPTPAKVIASKAAAAAAKNTAVAATENAPAAAEKEVPFSETGASGRGLRMATRRTKISSLGMAGNGTPAPKRRTARGGY